MIDAALAAAIATAPAGPGNDPAPAEGFGDLLSQMLAAATAAAEQAATAAQPVPAEPAGTAVAATAEGAEPAPIPGDPATTATTVAALAALSGGHAGGKAFGRTDGAEQTGQTALQGDQAVMGGVAEPALPLEAQAGKAASSAGQAADRAHANAAANSAVALTAAPAAAAEAEPDENAQAPTAGAASDGADLALSGHDAPAGAAAPAERPQRIGTSPASVQPAAVTEAAPTGEAPAAPVAAREPRPAAPVAPAAAAPAFDGGAARADSAAVVADVAPAGPPMELFASGALRRVMEAIEAAEHRPPPNTMAVEIAGEGAEETLRLLVSVRGGVVEITGQGDRALPPGWARPLADALAQRGLSLDGFGPGDTMAGRSSDDQADGQADDPRDGRAPAAPGARGVGHLPTSSLSTGNDGALRL